MSSTSSVVPVDSQATLGEHPFWEDEEHVVTWIDMVGGVIRRTDTSGGASTATSSPFPNLGAALPTSAGPMLLVTLTSIGTWNGTTFSQLDELAENGLRFNDASCDPSGRVWIGSTATDGTSGRGQLSVWQPRSGLRVVRTGFRLPNGIGWSPTGEAMYLADSEQGVVLRAPVDPRTDEPGDFEPFIHIDGGVPDGLCVDDEGDLWIAIWDGARIERRSATGRLMDTVTYPVSRVASCAMSSRGELFATTARYGLAAEVLRVEPDAGRPFVTMVDAAGSTHKVAL